MLRILLAYCRTKSWHIAVQKAGEMPYKAGRKPYIKLAKSHTTLNCKQRNKQDEKQNLK